MLDDFNMREAAPPTRPQQTFDAPLKTLADLDTPTELMLQYQRAETLAQSVLTDPDIAANQKAQVLAAVTAVLTQIIKLQTELHNSEEFKRIEMTLADTLKRFPELQEDFMSNLRRELQ